MIIQNGSVIAKRLPPKCVPTKLRLYQCRFSTTRAWRKSSDISSTRMPANRNGGQRLRMRRIARADGSRIASASEEERGHLAAIRADQLGVVEHVERGDEMLLRLAVVPRAIGLQHCEQLVEPAGRIAVEQQPKAEQVARGVIGRVLRD